MNLFLNLLLSFSLGFALSTNVIAGASVQANPELREINQLSEQGNQSAALDRVNSFLAKNPRNAEALFMKGVFQVELNKRDEAIKTFIDLSEKYPNLPEPYNNLAVLYADMGQFDKARVALESAIKTHPSYATAHENLGDIYARLASEAYDKALKLDTSNARAQNKLALITDLFGGKKVATKNGTKPITPAPTPAPPPAPVAATSAPTVALPAVASKPVANVVAPVVGNQESAVISSIEAWAADWSSQNVKKYLSHYAKNFKTPKGESRKDWEDMRRERVTRPSKISVKIAQPKVSFVNDEEVKVVFKQTYATTGAGETIYKTLTMVKEGGEWLIKQEKVGR